MSPVYLFQLEHAQIQISQGGRLGGRGEGYLSLLEGGGARHILLCKLRNFNFNVYLRFSRKYVNFYRETGFIIMVHNSTGTNSM